MNVADFDYQLPEELVAQTPAKRRDDARLLVLDRRTGRTSHTRFFDIEQYLHKGDVLVLNDSRVLPARLFGVKEGTGGKVEFLLTKSQSGDVWETMVRPGKRLQKGERVLFGVDGEHYGALCDIKGSGRKTADMEAIEKAAPLVAEVIGYGEDGTRLVRFWYRGVFLEVLSQLGHMPLPPYIERPDLEMDKERYQTVYSRVDGSVAAPTAGLHFTEDLLARLAGSGVELVYLTLHVGIGTFRPVTAETVEEHHMHFEEYEVSEEAAAAIRRAKEEGRRVIAVGTTSTRTLEAAAQADGSIAAGRGSTDIFIYPGYEFRIIDGLITNFHLPKSTLLMLVSALAGREHILAAYEEAVRERYRFFSYGDAMLIL